MAITRTQIARQLYKDGKRVALSNGSYDEEVGVNTPDRRSTYDEEVGVNTPDRRSTYDAPTGAVDDPFSGGQKMSRETGGQGTETFYVGQSPDYEFSRLNTTGYDEETGVNTPPRNVGGGDGGNGGADDSLQRLYNQGIPDSNIPGVGGTVLDMFQGKRNKSLRKNIDFYRYDSITSKARRKYGVTADGYEQYMKDRLAGKIDAAGNIAHGFMEGPGGQIIPTGNDNNQPIIPIQRPLNTNQVTEEVAEETGVEDPFKLARRFRADGGMMDDDLTGGIMDLETGRQMYFLGKLVKKATRAVKKIAKSPIGKAALLYAGGTFLGGLQRFGGAGFGSGTFLSNLKSGQGIANLGGFLKGKLFDTAIPKPGTDSTGLLSKLFSPEGFILGSSIISGLTAEQEQEAQLLADNTGIDINEARNQILKAAAGQDDFRSRAFKAGGGIMRLGYQEGSKEPVAKKTMPLLDMGGMEKDYREDGGFVPIGRMEKADDVPARLSKNEFVFTADAVRNAGDGDIDKGAEVMYNMMKNLEAGGEVSEESQGLEGAREMFQTSRRLEEVL